MSSEILVFVVEDEPIIQEMLQTVLTDTGFAVKIAASGEEAIACLDAEAADFRGLVTDVNLLPGSLTGWDVARHARELQPELPIVYMTGAAGHEWSSLGVPGSVLVPKPFVPAQIVTALTSLLNNARGAGTSAPA